MLILNKVTFLCLFLFKIGFSWNYETCPVENERCSPAKCQLPDCACSGTEPEPDVKNRPQIVYLTFDDAMTKEFDDLYYTELFMPNEVGDYKYTNPNGCPIKATFFVSAKSNQYDITNKYWRYKHEIASHSITHRYNTTYWAGLSPQGWKDEMDGVREMLVEFAMIDTKDEIRGMRAPFLQSGGDEMLTMMKNVGFEYDCSAPTRAFGYTNMKYGRWPYTLDYKSGMDCQIEPCPKCKAEGVWSQPILDFEDARVAPDGNGYPCGMTDTCQGFGGSNVTLFNMLMKNFDRAYNGKTRAPIGIYIHTAWFVRDYSWHYEGYKMFLDEITNKTKYNDVWIVPIHSGIEYMKAQTLTNDKILSDGFEPFERGCDESVIDKDSCPELVCHYTVDNEEIPGPIEYYFHACGFTCPENFPWLGNPLGE